MTHKQKTRKRPRGRGEGKWALASAWDEQRTVWACAQQQARLLNRWWPHPSVASADGLPTVPLTAGSTADVR
eukprot:scaffold168503_cov33-Tisochrysis_lutea.AAC.2